MIAVVNLYDWQLQIPSTFAWALVAMFTWLFHKQLKKLLHNVLSKESYAALSSHRFKLAATSILLFALLPILSSFALAEPKIYTYTIHFLVLLSLIRPHFFEPKI